MNNLLFSGVKKIIPPSVIYLQNSLVVIDGIKIYGSPISPYFLGMTFNKKRGAAIKTQWNKIPIDTDVLITHTPPMGILDNQLGCEDLLNKVDLVKPQLHIFGHIHQHSGLAKQQHTTFVNAAMVNNLKPFENKPCKIVAKPFLINI